MNDTNTSDGFERFKQSFVDSYDKEDLDILNLFLPIAEKLASKDFPQLKDTKSLGKRFNLQALVDMAKPMLDAIIPDRLKKLYMNSDGKDKIPNEILKLKGREDVTFEQTIALSNHIAENIAPSLKYGVQELHQGSRITTNAREGTQTEEESIRYYKNLLGTNVRSLTKAENELRELKATGGDPWHMASLEENIAECKKMIKSCEIQIEECLDEIEKKKDNFQETHYNANMDTMNLNQHFTPTDASDLLHEAGHKAARMYALNGNRRLEELPSITAEFTGIRYMAKHGIENEHRIIGMVCAMQRNASKIVGLNKMFAEYENTGDLSYKTVDNAIVGGKMREESKPVGDYSKKDQESFDYMMKMYKYFVGITSSLVLQEKIKSKEDLQNVFDVMNNPAITDTQRIKKYGITRESLKHALDNFVTKHRTDERLRYSLGGIKKDFSQQDVK